MKYKMRVFLALLLTLPLAACGGQATKKAPVAPTGLTATPGNSKVTLRWQDNSDDETGFAIYRQVAPSTASVQKVSPRASLETLGLETLADEGFAELTTVPENTTEYDDTGVEPGTLYRYAVSAINGSGASATTGIESGQAVGANTAPVANARKVSTVQNTPIAVILSGSDPDGDTLTYKVVTAPKNGTLKGNAPKLTYTPSKDYNGEDSFTFTVSDGKATSAPATVSLSIGKVNAAPIANAQTVSTSENTPVVVTLSGRDSDGGSLTFQVVTQPQHGTLKGAAPKLTYTPNKGYSGADSFTFTVSDSRATSAPATVSLTISNVNDAPVANPQERSTPEDTPLTLTLTGSDQDGDTLSFAITTQPGKGSLGAIDQSTGKVLYTPNENANGQDSFTFTVSDGESTSAPATVSINLGVINDPPVATAQPVSTSEDTAAGITLAAFDPDSDTLSFEVVTPPTHGSLSGTAPDLTYTPDENYNGPDSFTFKANDGSDDSSPATVSITVTAVDDAPIIAGDDSVQVTMSEDGSPTAFALAPLSASDMDGDTLTWSVSQSAGHGSASVTDGVVSYSPAANYFGSDSFQVEVSDGTLTDTVTVDVTVESVNDAPTAEAQTLTTDEDTDLAITLAATDSDGDALSYEVVTQPSNGTLSGTAPSLTYTPNPNYNGDDSFTFRANDSFVDSAEATVSITVTAVNDAPTFTSTPVTTAREDKAYSYAVTTADLDTGDTLTIVATTQPAWLTLSDNGDGSATLSGVPGSSDLGDHAVTLQVSDGAGASAEQSFTVSVADSLVVTTSADSGEGSLRQTVADAQADETITFANDVQTITLTSGEIVLAKNVTISGDVTLDGNANSRIFTISSGATVVLKDLTLTNGKTNGNGGAIYNQGTLTLQGNSSISNNTAASWGGGVYNYPQSTLTMQDSSSISNNAATYYGGGIFLEQSTLTMQDSSSISSNTASQYAGGGVFNYYQSTTTLQNNSSISGNTAGQYGGGVANQYQSTLNGADYDGANGDDNIFGNTPDQVNNNYN